MYSILTARPDVSLRSFVSHFTQRDVSPSDAFRTAPVPACTQHAIEFQFHNRYEVHRYDSDSVDTGPRVAIVGPQTYRRTRLRISAHMDGFEMVFKPCAAYRLFGVEMAHLMNEGLDAESMLGKSISELWHRMGEATTFQQRIQIVEDFLIPYAQASRPAIAGLTSHISKLHGSVRVSDLASAAGISRRQLERQFRAQVGLTPKCFARIYRYESALLLKATIPKRSWSAIAHELGYSDHMHMVHDFQNLAGETPTETMAQFAYGLSLEPKAWFVLSPQD